MKIRFFYFCVLLIYCAAEAVWAQSGGPKPYDFPYKDPYLATILSKAAHTDVSFQTLKHEFRSDRNNIPGFKGDNAIAFNLFEHKGQLAPLAFVIAGTGGSASSGLALQLAGEIFELGYHVVTLPDPISQSYVLGRSESALPGYLPRDAKEYYVFLQEVTAVLKNQGLEISSYAVTGYSYGGLLTGFLMREDQLQAKFNFKKALIINPAIDVRYGVKVLDGDFGLGLNISKLRQDAIIAVMGLLIELDLKGKSSQSILKIFSEAGVTDPEMQWMIGDAFRLKLAQVLFATQQVYDAGVLQPADPSRIHRRKSAAKKFSFAQYMDQFVVPSLSEDEIRSDPNLNSADLYSVASVLANDARVFVMENADDILVKAGDLEFLQATFGSRFFLYPYGGHVGNLSAAQNQIDLRSIFN